LIGVTDTIRLTVYDNNRPQTITSGTVALYTPAGGVLQAAAAVSVDGTTQEMTYALTAVHTASADLNYKAVWDYIVSAVHYYQTQLFDVVKSQLSIPITDDDLYNELESLRKANYQVTVLATGGAAGTLIDTKRRESDNFWKGGTIEIVAGTCIGQKRDITGFTQSTGVFTVTPAWTTTTPDTTSIYVAVKSFTKKIQAAFDKICTMLYDKGKRHQLTLESSQIAIPLTYLTLHMISLDLTDEQNSRWDRLATLYWEKFDKSFNTMHLDYDEDESGTISDEETQKSQTELRIGRA